MKMAYMGSKKKTIKVYSVNVKAMTKDATKTTQRLVQILQETVLIESLSPCRSPLKLSFSL